MAGREEESVEEEANAIAEKMLAALVGRFTEREGREPRPEEVQELLEEMTPERVQELLQPDPVEQEELKGQGDEEKSKEEDPLKPQEEKDSDNIDSKGLSPDISSKRKPTQEKTEGRDDTNENEKIINGEKKIKTTHE